MLHALVVVFALQLSGLGDAVADAVGLMGHEAHDAPDCSDGGEDCPPGCPDCHCAQAPSLVVTEALGEPFEFVTIIDFALASAAHRTLPFNPGVYRPPRA